MALPPGAVLEATLEDVSRADAAAEVIGRTRVEGPGNPPFRFEIPYDPPRIDSRRRYTVRARIMVDGKPFFTTDQHYAVLTGGAGNEAEPHLILNSATRQVGGAGGCNRLTGGYELNGGRLSLGRVASTIMACAEGMDTEKAFMDALGRVSGWRIAGQQLELLDSAGNVIARFEARPME
jgi:putative lipoprotein